ncbi:MAG: phosphate transport system permease protein [Candidatus Atribacteria bacterium]|jgi:phosphate transport system permease protein|uniref:phosphate ABC transporter permease PstA n=1 Tax=Atrimonas thermophila TaxID=3064161 RepID=UPI0024AAB3F1|nr:phosphate transport system permease protein [Candidatus Atribacteria bacterium]
MSESKSLELDLFLKRKKTKEKIFLILATSALLLSLIALFVLLIDVFYDGIPRLGWQFLTSFPSRRPERAGILPALVGSIYVVGLTICFSVPLGVGAGIYLEEYSRKDWLSKLIEINVSTLAGVPSIIYGILGLELFVRTMRLGRGLLAGALTLTLLVLPIIIVSTREAIRAVPLSLREAAFALGATRWQVIKDQVLPVAIPGILTGVILAVSRAIGETAPLIMIGALTYIAFLPDSLNAPFTALPIQIFNWVSRPQKGFHANAAAGIVVLLVITLSLNSLSIFLRNYFQKKTSSRVA